MTEVFSQPVICPTLVGRQAALAKLRLLLEESRSRGRVALISGEAGIGKSRLLGELSAEANAARLRVLRAGFFEQDTAVPFSAHTRLLDSILAADDSRTAAVLTSYAGSLRPIAPIVTAFATSGETADQDTTPERVKHRIVDGLARLVRSLATDQATLLAFEDLHWGDEASLEAILEFARDAAPGCLMVLTYRDDEHAPPLDTLLAELDRQRLSTEIGLKHLSLSEVDLMLRSILGREHSTRADVLHVLYQLTEGNPFLVEELLRSVVDAAGSLEGSIACSWPTSTCRAASTRQCGAAPAASPRMPASCSRSPR